MPNKKPNKLTFAKWDKYNACCANCKGRKICPFYARFEDDGELCVHWILDRSVPRPVIRTIWNDR